MDRSNEFKTWLLENSEKDSGKVSSYIYALIYLSRYLSKNIFELSNISELNKLLQEVRENQKKNDGSYYNSKVLSYGKGGFYSASLLQYINFLQSLPEREYISSLDLDKFSVQKNFESLLSGSGDLIVEGTKVKSTVSIYERSRRARLICLSHYGYTCCICGFNFAQVYGKIGEDFIHVHHLTMLSEIGEEQKIDPVKDLRPVCPNCHAMLHRQVPPLTIEEFKEIVKCNS